MTARKVFVTQATGQTGVNTIRMLSERPSTGIEVFAGVNKSARMATTHEEILKGLPGVHCVCVDAHESSKIADQLKEVEELFLIPSSTAENKVEGARAYIDAAKRANVKFILLLSVLHPDAEGYNWGGQFLQIEKHLQESGIPWTVIRSNFYVQYLSLFKGPVSKGILPLPIGNGRFSPVDVADVASFARAVLSDPTPFRFKTFDLTGPTALSGDDIASILTRALGHPVRFEDATPDEAMGYLREAGLPDHETHGFRQFFELTKRNSQFDMATTYYYKSVMKREPRSLEDSVRLNKSTWLGESASSKSSTGCC